MNKIKFTSTLKKGLKKFCSDQLNQPITTLACLGDHLNQLSVHFLQCGSVLNFAAHSTETSLLGYCIKAQVQNIPVFNVGPKVNGESTAFCSHTCLSPLKALVNIVRRAEACLCLPLRVFSAQGNIYLSAGCREGCSRREGCR